MALVVLTVGLLGIAGLLRLAARETALARRVEAAQWDAVAVADSILAGRLGVEGERTAAWGVLRWGPSESGLRLEALPDDVEGREPYLRIRVVLPEEGS